MSRVIGMWVSPFQRLAGWTLGSVVLGGLCSSYAAASGLSLIDFTSVSAFGSAGAGRGVNVDASVMSTNPAGLSLLKRPQAVIGGMGIFAGGEAHGTYSSIASNPPTAGRSYTPDEVEYYQFLGSASSNYQSCTGFDGDPSQCYVQNSKESGFLHPAVVPSIYYAQPVTDDIWAGVGVYASFGGETDYPIESAFRYQALSSKTQVVVVQPTVSMALSPELSIGGGLKISAGQLAMSRMLNPWASAITDAQADITGDGIGVGANLGAIWQPVPEVTLGLSYSSPVKVKFKGDLKATGVAGLGVVMDRFATADDPSAAMEYPEPIPAAVDSAQWIMDTRLTTTKEDIRTDITFPEHVDLSLSWQLNPEWTVLGSAIWTRWSRMHNIKITTHGSVAGESASDIVSVSNGAPGGNVLAYVPQNWSDVWALAVGTHYQLNDKTVLRFGYAYDNSPTKNSTRSARIPDNDRQWLTVGLGYELDSTYSIDLAYGYMFMKPFKIHDVNHKVDGSQQAVNPETALFEDPGVLNAKYKRMHAHALAAQLKVKF
ncbi:OmpP1/FadL family transporter [Parendozoicomonas haliclonae]|uniref:Putative outer membrane protein n=1 Tax=Parendozoicomonas haliclonae TaxID=1960125 RepID=A0A1X7AMK9_9GAMM|nr:outer membrane protein transport protein [Parendozoicomonas haliclonae]SMA47438.1 putative outer membrane protein precursor [Parendozoicomonas haliclonae]